MRRLLIAVASLALVAFATVAHADPSPEVLLVPSFGRPERIEAAPNGRAWVVGGVGAHAAFVVGPADSVERLSDELNAPFPLEAAPPGERLVLGKDGTIEQSGAAAPLPQSFLKQLGSKVFRKALTYDATRGWYVLLRSQRPLAAGTAVRRLRPTGSSFR